MTVTETTAVVEAPAAAPNEGRGLAAVLGSGDPRTIGRLFIGTSLVFLLATGITGALVSAERLDTAGLDLLEDSLGQIFTLHSIGGVFLFALPLVIGILAVVVPLQIGASTVAFPRALAASYWTYLVSGGLVIAAYAMNGGPFGGDTDGIDLFLTSLVAVLLALATATVVLVTTVATLRAPGMTLRRTPLLSWSTLVGGVVWLLTLPVLAAIVVLLYVDHRWGEGQLLAGEGGGIYERIRWAFFQPTVFTFAIPALGMIADVVPVFARRRLQLHAVAMTAIGLYAALSLGAWAQLAYTLSGSSDDPTPWLHDVPWVGTAFLSLAAFGVLVLLWADTLRRGAVVVGSPLLLATVAVIALGVGALQRALTAIEGLELFGTTWSTAEAHHVLIGLTAASFAALAFWAPKIYGRLLPEGAARALAGALLLGAVLLDVPDMISGFLDQSAQFLGVGDDVSTIEALNAASLAGGVLLGLGAVGFVGLLLAPRRGDAPGDDPWSGHTLEWTTSSPPPVGSFASLPPITSEAPLYDARAPQSTDTSA
jgi:heme/copper-type cytochrome/quinol oxidase subunit 1